MEVLIATLLSCSSAKGIIDKIPLNAEFRSEIVETIQSGTEEGCFETQKPTKGTD
tara:strand:+ start:250 stop:414 length:165 start_codon:yes stop_codon:yes gene_type:complete